MRIFLSQLRMFVALLLLAQVFVFAPSVAVGQACMPGSSTSSASCQAVVTKNQTAPIPEQSAGIRQNAGVTNVLYDSYPTLCRFIDNTDANNDYFVPQNSFAEFSAFVQNHPVPIQLANCTQPSSVTGITFSATSSLPYAVFEITQEGGPMIPLAPDVPVTLSGINVPTNGSIERVGATETVSVISAADPAQIEFQYTREDCIPNTTTCNPRAIVEMQTLSFTAQASPSGGDGIWVEDFPVASTWYVEDPKTGVLTLLAGPLADYEPPTTCDFNGTTYKNGQSWTSPVTSTQPATAAECPGGPGSRIDNISTPTNYTCVNAVVTQTGAGTPTETGFTGSCGNTPPSSSTIYVVDSGNDRIEAFDTMGNFLFQFGTHGTGPGQFSTPYAARIDNNGNLLVTDNNNNRVQRFDPSGNYIGEIDLTNPDMAAQAPNGNIWVSSSSVLYMSIYNSTGALQFITTNWQDSSGVAGLAFDSAGDTWISDIAFDTIMKVDPQGNPLFSFGGTGTGPGQFGHAWDLAIDAQDRIWVTDGGNSRVQVFDNTGEFLFMFGTLGTGPGQFGSEIGMDPAIDSSGNVWVTDADNDRVEEFDSTGKFLFQFGSFGSNGAGPGNLNVPIGIAIR